ncbi:unnamed protein product, partial [Choristocarpus tenellus]
TSPSLPPPPRALELVKEEVCRALRHFSSHPLKGCPSPPLPSDLLHQFDIARDGKVTYGDFKAGLKGLGLGLTMTEEDQLAGDFDEGGIGLVDREKFEHMASLDLTRDPTKWEGHGSGIDWSSMQEKKENLHTSLEEYQSSYSPVECWSGGNTIQSQRSEHSSQSLACDTSWGSREWSKRLVQSRPLSTWPSNSSLSFENWKNIANAGSPVTGIHLDASPKKNKTTPRSYQASVRQGALLQGHIAQQGNALRRTRSQHMQDQEGDKGEHDPPRSDNNRGRVTTQARTNRKQGPRPHSAPPGGRDQGFRGNGDERRSILEESLDRNRIKREVRKNSIWNAANRAESIIYHKSGGNLMGLRWKLAGADPSGSGVLTANELAVTARRFGIGLDDKESNALAARYGRGCHSGIDYGHLIDTLEARAAKLPISEAGVGSRKRLEKQESAPLAQSRTMHSGKRNTWQSNVNWGMGRGLKGSQLGRRACGKALALLDRQGERSVENVLHLVNPARHEGISAKQLRQSLCILAGGDPLSDIEHQALFQIVSNGSQKVQRRELVDILRANEMEEQQMHVRRKIQREAEHRRHNRDWALHLRHSKVLDWHSPIGPVPTGGYHHPEAHRDGLVYQRVCDRVRKVQERCSSAAPVREHAKNVNSRMDCYIEIPSDTTKISGTRNPTKPLRVSPQTLRSKLSSLGVPLGDEDFTTLLARINPSGHGDVTYKDFCNSLHLPCYQGGHDIGGMRASDDTAAESVPLESHPFTSAIQNRALALMVSDELTCDGGLFHHNEATAGCTNPNFTTTMIAGQDTQRSSISYRPKRHQSPAPAPAARRSGCRSGSQGQTVVLGGDQPESWALMDEGELGFSRSSPYGSGSAGQKSKRTCIDRHKTPGSSAPDLELFTNLRDRKLHESKPIVEGNRRGQGHRPPDNDLGFGSDRMILSAGIQYYREGRDTNGPTGDQTKRHLRTKRTGAEGQYGAWASSSIREILQHD